MGDNITSHTLDYVYSRIAGGEIVGVTAKADRLILAGFARTMGNRQLRNLHRGDIAHWRTTLTNLAPATQRNRWTVVKCFLAWCVTEGRLAKHPMAGMKAPKVPRPVHRALDIDQTTALFSACRDSRDRLILELGLQLGLRRKEIAGIEMGDVSLRAMNVTVIGKGGHGRNVPLTDAAAKAIKAYLADNPTITAGPLLRSFHPRYRHQGVRPRWVGDQVERIAYDAGIKRGRGDGVSTHAMRHTAASDIYAQHGDVKAVQDILGHRSLATTEIYTRGLNSDRLREAMEGRRYVA